MELHTTKSSPSLISSWAIVLVAFFCHLACTTVAYKFYVGGRDGWVVHPSEDYNHWAGRNRFSINDTLHFKYNKGEDSVLLVSKDDHDSCNTKSSIQKWDDGDTTFTFDRSGPFFFISGQDDHCRNGQKLIVVVLALRRPPPLVPAMPPPPPTKAPVTSPPAMAPTPAPVSLPPPSGGGKAPAPTPVISPPSQAPGAQVPSPMPSGPATSPSEVPGPAATPPPTNSPPSPLGSTAPSAGGSVSPGTPSTGLPTNGTGSPTPPPPGSSAGAVGPSVGLVLAMVFLVTT